MSITRDTTAGSPLFTDDYFDPRQGDGGNPPELLQSLFGGEFNIDTSSIHSPGCHKLNMLHYSVVQADLLLLEEAVKLGAALDFPTAEGNEMLPPGCTALHLVCLQVSMFVGVCVGGGVM